MALQEHFSASHENRKVAILVNKVVLAEQHAESCKAKLPPEIRTKLITGGNDDPISLSLLLQDSDVFVMTVQILVDALAFDEIPGLSEFTLIVFDECHHTQKKNPYNVVMGSYLDEKFREGGPKRRLPQVHQYVYKVQAIFLACDNSADLRQRISYDGFQF